SERYVQIVPTSTLDRALGTRFHGRRCLMIVDIEGAEKQLIEGASSLLAADPKPIWMIEITTSEHQPKGTSINPHLLPTFQIFWGAGYEAWTTDKIPRRVTPDEVRAISDSGRSSFHVHNFLFIGEGSKEEILGR
ncbi:MAG: hypothetical protein ABIU95_05805, partial [Burkholderiales bacterium]